MAGANDTMDIKV
jgi:hypothetical protein